MKLKENQKKIHNNIFFFNGHLLLFDIFNLKIIRTQKFKMKKLYIHHEFLLAVTLPLCKVIVISRG